MQTYYHNTTPDNPDNKTLMYISNYGGWSQDIADLQDDDFDTGEQVVIKVIYGGGLICCEPLDGYLSQLNDELCKKYKHLMD